MQELRCKKCGSFLERQGEMYICPACGAQYETESACRNAEEFVRVLDEQKQEAVANLKAQLWKEFSEEFYDSAEISRLAKEIKKYLPNNFFANFCDFASGGNAHKLNEFLFKTDVVAHSEYVWDMLGFLMRPLREENLLAVNDLLARTKDKGLDMERFRQYNELLAQEAKKLNDGVYDVTLPRDVFMAYSSADMAQVGELVETLEGQNISCFVAVRNLQHGAIQNYDIQLHKAMDHCKVLVFVSSENSRNRTSDALEMELSYIRQKDLETAPAKYRNYYEKMPPEYKKPRVEYLISRHTNTAADKVVEELFAGYEQCYDKNNLAQIILKYLALNPMSNVKYCAVCGAENGKNAKFCAECGGRSFVSTREEWEEKQRAQEEAVRETEAVRRAEEDRRRAEEEKNKAAEAQKRAEAAKKKAEEEAAALRAELERLKAAAAKTVSEPSIDPSVKRSEPAQPKSASQPTPSASPAEDFEIKDGVLVKYKGKGGDVVLPNGVTSIGNSVFKDCSGLTGITIPNSVMSIGDSAFEGCSGLTSITIPRSVTSIGGWAFACCDSLKSVKLPDNITSIEEYTFKACISLASITIPNKVTSIGVEAFSSCCSLTSIAIPSSVVNIEMSAFDDCSSLTSVTLSNGVVSVEDGAFQDCTELTDIAFPGSMRYIERHVFEGCSGLERVTIPLQLEVLDAEAFPDGTKIYCHSPKPKDYPKGWDESYRNRIVWDSEQGTVARSASAERPESAQSQSAAKPEPLASPAKDFKIRGCELIKYRGKGGDVVIPNGITRIGQSAFKNCSSLTSVTIPNGVTSIGECAFRFCVSLTSITIPNGVTSIGKETFEGCSSLKSITIPDSVTSIGDRAFWRCKDLTGITIPSSVWSIGENVLGNCTGLESISVDRRNIAYYSEGNCLIERTSKKLIAGCKNSKIPKGGSVTSIGDSAFYGCSNLTNITIPSGVESIGGWAFKSCSGLTDIEISNTVASIEYGAFEGCSGLTSIKIPSSVTLIGGRVLSYCTGLERISVDQRNMAYYSEGNCLIGRMSKQLIAGCKNSKIPADGSVTSISWKAFEGCNGLKSIEIPDSVTSIGLNAFEGCRGLISITIPNSVTSIGEEAFNHCPAKIYCHRKKPFFWPKGWDKSLKGKIIWDK